MNGFAFLLALLFALQIFALLPPPSALLHFLRLYLGACWTRACYGLLWHFLSPVENNTLIRPFFRSRSGFAVSISGVRNSKAHLMLALEAGDTFDDLIRKLRNRHVLWSSQKLRPVFCTSDSTGFRGSDIVPYAEATLFLQVDVDLDLSSSPWSAFSLFKNFQPGPNRFRSQVGPSPRSLHTGQVFVMVNGRTVTLNLWNLHSDTKVADVFDRLIARRALRPSDLGSCYLSYRSRPLSQDLTLSEIKIGRNSTLTLHWRLRGGARRDDSKPPIEFPSQQGCQRNPRHFSKAYRQFFRKQLTAAEPFSDSLHVLRKLKRSRSRSLSRLHSLFSDGDALFQGGGDEAAGSPNWEEDLHNSCALQSNDGGTNLFDGVTASQSPSRPQEADRHGLFSLLQSDNPFEGRAEAVESLSPESTQMPLSSQPNTAPAEDEIQAVQCPVQTSGRHAIVHRCSVVLQSRKRPRPRSPSSLEDFSPSSSGTEPLSEDDFIPPPQKRGKTAAAASPTRKAPSTRIRTRTRRQSIQPAKATRLSISSLSERGPSSPAAAMVGTNEKSLNDVQGHEGDETAVTSQKLRLAAGEPYLQPNMCQGDPRKVSKRLASVRILNSGPELAYEFNGRRCQHENPATATSLPSNPWPRSDEPSSPASAQAVTVNLAEEHLDNSCAGLSAHSISMCGPINAFFCHLHRDFIPPSGIIHHIRKSHANTLPAGNNHVANFINHLQTVYPGIAEGDASGPKRGMTRHFTIMTPISFLPEPSLYVFCRSPSCPALFKWAATSISRTYRNHVMCSPDCRALLGLKSKPSGQDWEAVKHTLKYAQVTSPSSDSRWVFALPDGWTPLPTAVDPSSQPSLPIQASESLTPPETATGPPQVYQPYIAELGWDKAFPAQHLAAFKSLLEMPAAEDEDANTEEMALERGLSEIYDFLFTYLQSANQFVEGRCAIVRQSITRGSRSKFRQLSPRTIGYYRDPLIHVISFLLWFKFQCDSRKQIVNCVDLGLTSEVKCAVSKLYAFLITSSGQRAEIDRGNLAKHVHRLLTLLLIGQGPSYRKIDGPFDYTLLLAMYAGNGNFEEPEIIGRYCAMLQYCMRVIVVHIVRLGGLHIDFMPLVPRTDPNLEEQDAEEEDNPLLPPAVLPLPKGYKLVAPSLDDRLIDPEKMTIENPLTLDLDEPDNDPSAPTNPWKSIPTLSSNRFVNPMYITAEEEESMLTIGGEDELNNLHQDELLEVLESYHKWISHKSDPGKGKQPTAYQRMKTFWLIIWPHAINAITKTQIQWDDKGHVLTFSDSRRSPFPIQLRDLRALARSIVAEAQKRMEELLPSGIPIRELLEAVDLRSLQDDPASQRSFLEQNRGVFEPLVEKVFQSLTSPTQAERRLTLRKPNAKGKYRLDLLKAWFHKEQGLLRSILCAHFLTSGIPPRGFQVAESRITSSKAGRRNVFIMKGYLVFGWPRSKAFSRAVHAALWSFPPALGQIVTIYLGILRPVALRMAENAGLDPSPDAKHMVFANTISVGARADVWSSKYISRVLTSRTAGPIGLSLGPQRLRQIMSAVFRKHLSTLIDPTARSSYQAHLRTSHANRQADHTQLTSNLHYGVSFGPLSSLNLSDADVDQFIEVSQAWQAILGLVPGSRRILDLLYGVPQFKESVHTEFAYERVRVLLCRHYRLGGDRKASGETAELLLSSVPFIPSAQSHFLGNKTLWEIASILVFGKGRPGVTDAAPLTGYSPAIITEAITLILLGLGEWTRLEDLEYDLQDLSVISAMDDARKLILLPMEKIEKQSPAAWTELGVRIFDQAFLPRNEKLTMVNPLARIDFDALMDVDED